MQHYNMNCASQCFILVVISLSDIQYDVHNIEHYHAVAEPVSALLAIISRIDQIIVICTVYNRIYLIIA